MNVIPSPRDRAASLFQEQWTIYRKMVDNNYLFHHEAYGCLRDLILRNAPRGFSFLDVACGDARGTIGVLDGTPIGRFIGIDLSAPALAVARKTTATLDCPVDLIESDFRTALKSIKGQIDIAWIGLSLHHFANDQKLPILAQLRHLVGREGLVVFYENASPDGEDRDQWLQRWDLQQSLWTALTPVEWHAVRDHVRSSDYPETRSAWIALGHLAGFSQIEEMMVSPTDLFRMFALRA
ncbi:class I SAM-dependent methyltransferase [Mesorhizobium loti]|uniref:class I SAM-dependent methyltransferase n=1 Tax=Rhizobium loti TaxID=381 RepID=UPI001269274E|nr:class I SAM-dependent methyltransferase [Mesorhizobium loti]